MKNSLAYSELTDAVYWIDGKGGRHECTKNFINVMLLWLTQSQGLPPIGEKHARNLKGSNGTGVQVACHVFTENNISPRKN